MDQHERDLFSSLLQRLLDGSAGREDIAAALGTSPPPVSYERVEDFAKIDLTRVGRTGVPEFIYSPGKSPDQVSAIARRMIDAGARNIIATRASREMFDLLAPAFPASVFHPLSGTIVFAADDSIPRVGRIGIVTAGTADLPVAEEAELACHALGSATVRIADVGVACIARTLDAVPALREMNAIVCAAGMEATLPVVLAGLVSVPVIAVPTSVGYGVNAGGFNALLTVLGACTPGLLAVNIDNGVGAAAAAHRINLLAEGRRP